MTTTIKTLVKLGKIKGRTWFVGDLHGHYDLLMTTLLQVGFDFSHDRLIATGDLVDHGSRSESCVKLLQRHWFFSVIGNHEELLLDAYMTRHNDMGSRQLHTSNGGGWFYDDCCEDCKKETVGLILSSMPLAYEVEAEGAKIGVIHASTRGDWRGLLAEGDFIDTRKIDKYTWTRYHHGLPSHVLNIDAVVMGHQGDMNVVQRSNQFWIDTIRNAGKLTVMPAEQVLRLAKTRAN